MNEPVTTIDPRYGDSGAVPTPWEETRRALETAELFWLSTVRANGRPHVTPIAAVWLDGTLHFCTGVTQQKGINLRGNPYVTLTTGCNTWEEGCDVVVEGDAVRITDETMLRRLASAWATKWDGRFQFLVRDDCFYHQDEHGAPLGEAVFVFAVNPIKAFVFTRGRTSGTNSHTRHQF